jgi:squalene-associated FAD-dependent desaturase
MTGTIHIIGAGLAGLAAAIRLAEKGKRVVVHEANAQAGGRCRSFFDHTLQMTIDNGNHLLLSGNRAALSFLDTVGARHHLVGPDSADFPFFDCRTRTHWTLRIGSGRIPFWIFDEGRRVPGTRPLDYLKVAPLLWADKDRTVGDTIPCRGPLFEKLIRPLLVAALNVGAEEGSARLAGAVVRETLFQGGQACRPLIAREGLTPAFIDPALAFLRGKGAKIRLEHQLHAIAFAEGSARALQFADGDVALGPDDRVVLAVPFWIASALLPQIVTPTQTRAIVNGHFRFGRIAGIPPIIGLVNATTEWIFAFPDRISVTISNADRLVSAPRERLAQEIWAEIRAATGIADPLPAWQIVRERRATFASIPGEDARRPGPKTRWSNLVLAGDWTDTGLPATIEGSIRSGFRAAQSLQD